MILPSFSKSSRFLKLLQTEKPAATAAVKGSPQYPNLSGEVKFYPASGGGTLVLVEVHGLPKPGTPGCPEGVFGFHVHEGAACTGTREEPFKNAGGHLNPGGCPHPAHMGDMPPIFGNDGYGWMTFYTTRFRPSDVVGHTVIIHGGHDDFTTQPSGNSGPMIACGPIVKR